MEYEILAGTLGGQRDPNGKATRPGIATTSTGGRPSIGGWPDKGGMPSVGGWPDKPDGNGGGPMLPRPCYSERVCRFVDEQIAGLRESAGGSRFCLREVCRAAREGVDDFEKFVRGRRGADPRKVKSPHNYSVALRLREILFLSMLNTSASAQLAWHIHATWE